VKYGRLYRKQRRLIRDSRGWDAKRMWEYQQNTLRDLLVHAGAHVPYYRELFREIGFNPCGIDAPEKFQRLPFLTKSLLKTRFEDLRADNIPRSKLSLGATGGATGEPVQFYQIRKRIGQIEGAFVDEIWKTAGVSERDSIAVLRGTPVGPNPSDGFHWKHRPFHRVLLLSTFHLSEESAAHYASLMIRFRIRHLHAFPSSFVQFARYIQDMGLRFPDMKTILTSSEVVLNWMRDLSLEVFDAPLFDLYGSSEKTVIAGQCSDDGKMMVYPQYGYTELVEDDGSLITEPGIPGEIVGTSFIRHATPLIRYRTGDIGVLYRHLSPGSWPILSRIQGRTGDYVYSSGERKVSVSLLNLHSDVLRNVLKFQFYQDTPGELVLRIVPGEGYTDSDSNRLKSKLEEILGEAFILILSLQDSVATTARAKSPILIQRLDRTRTTSDPHS
jgi:phenylacetate-CoA ligase